MKNIEDVYQKKTTETWGDIFSWVFNKKQFNKSYALVIGIGNYQKGWPILEAPYYDAIRVRDYLINDAGFDYVLTLTNEKVTKQKINKLMEEIFPNLLNENDRFLFYFSGHGTQRTIGDINIPFGYLVLQNCDLKSYGSMINMEDIERWDRLLYPVKHVLFVLDCCFSGLAGQQRKSPLTDKKLDRLSQYAHHLITAGTEAEESIASLKKWQGSLFTDSFLKAASGSADLSGKDYEPDGVISLKELMEYIGNRIDEETVKLKRKSPLSQGIKMSPQVSDLQDNSGEFFFITKHIKNKKMKNFIDNVLIQGWPAENKGDVDTKSYPLLQEHIIDNSKIAHDGTFISYGEHIVKDTKTGLEWVAGPDTDMTWDEAKLWVENLTIDGGGWRMPTRNELKTLYKEGEGTRNITPLLKITGWWVWTGETNNLLAWNINFNSNTECQGYHNISIGSRAFAVRSHK